MKVLIVGAGPAGATASNLLSREGLDVIVVERKSEPEKPVICGEFFPSKSLAAKFLPSDKYLDLMYMHFREKYIMAKHKGMEIAFNGISKKYPLDGVYIIDRYSFIGDIIKDSLNRGAELLNKTMFVDARYKNEKIKAKVFREGREVFIEADFIIGADAYPSRVAKAFKLPSKIPKSDLAQTITVRMVDVEYLEKFVYLLFSPEIAPRAYAWIFPSRNFFNVGVGLIDEDRRYPMGFYLKKFLSLEEFFSNAKIISKPVGKPLPVGGMNPKPADRKVFLVGDAAWLVVPTNGGGINTAMLSAIFAAESILVDPENAHIRYLKLMERYIKPLLDRTLKYRKGVERLYRRWKLFKTIAKIVPSKWIIGVILGEENFAGKIISLFS